MLLCTVYILLGLSITSTIIEAVRLEYAESWKRLQALAEALRRIGEGTSDSQTLRRDLGDIINIITDKGRPDWEATVNTIVTKIKPKQNKPKIIEIIIYETSVWFAVEVFDEIIEYFSKETYLLVDIFFNGITWLRQFY